MEGDGDVEREDSQLMQVSDEDQFIKNYKAVYNAMTAKPDCRSKAYPKEVIVSIDDIFDLNSRILDKFKNQYDHAGFSINVIVSIKGRQKLEFPNWKSFEEHKWIEAEIITGIVITWEFNVRLPKYKIPQRHTLMVKLSNGMSPEEMFGLFVSGKLDEIEEIEQNVCPIVARMDFIDPGIGNEVLEIVSEWVKGLKCSENQRPKWASFLQRNRRKVAYALNYFTVLVALLCSLTIIKNSISSLPIESISEITSAELCNLINILFACFLACFIIDKASELISNLIFKILADYGDEHIFNITNGDKNQREELQKKEKSDRKKIIINFIVTVVINISCGIAAYFITKGM